MVAIAAKVTARPASRTRQPASIAMRGLTPRNATVAVPRAWRGTPTRGRSEARTPARRVPGSCIASIPAAATLAPSSSHHTRRVGARPYWASALDPSAPAPSPRRGAVVVISGASPLPSG